MAKPAAVIDHDQGRDAVPDEGVDGDKLLLRQLKEEQIRAKLEAFAHELAAAKIRRDKAR